jgi:hypothetical protein
MRVENKPQGIQAERYLRKGDRNITLRRTLKRKFARGGGGKWISLNQDRICTTGVEHSVSAIQRLLVSAGTTFITENLGRNFWWLLELKMCKNNLDSC